MNYLSSIKEEKSIYILLLIVSSFYFNSRAGFVGINPIDSFFTFNAGYNILNGYFPFKDYWTITGPFVDFLQSIIFKVFGISWASYVMQASIFNFLITYLTFFTLSKFNLNIRYCFLYSLLVSLLAYPSSGTPYVDHQASYMSIISIYFFILAIKTGNKIYWFLLPIILGISFLTKQAPTGHIILIITLLSGIYFIFNFEIKKILFIIVGILSFSLFFLAILKLGEISFQSFINQYILFPLSIAENRLDFIFPIEIKRIFLRFKLIHLSYFILIAAAIKCIIKNFKNVKNNEVLIIISLVASAYALIAHQLMTINGMFIFFIIPILSGFSHVYYLKYFKKTKFFLYFLIILSISSTLHYGSKYIVSRDFMDLRNVNLEKAIDAKTFSQKLSGLKWITPFYPNEPEKEIFLLKEAINYIDSDTRKKTIVTDYQFISVILSQYDYSPNKYWFSYHAHPDKSSKYFENYKKFFINKLKKNEIKIIYVVKPLWGGNEVLETIVDSDCFVKNRVTEILDTYLIKYCSDFIKY